jgi:hypothetical protein
MSQKHLDRAEVLNLVYTGQADAMADAYARLMADLIPYQQFDGFKSVKDWNAAKGVQS